MKRFARMLFAGLGIVIAGSAMSLVPHKAATAGNGAPVTILNPSLPVTQSGPWNVGITGTPSVNIGTPTVNLGAGSTVGISGTPTVQVTGMPTVQLASGALSNTPSTPIFTRDKDNPALTPFQTRLCKGLNRFNPSASLCGTMSDTFTVGAGQRLVIEYVSFYCDATGSGVTIFATNIGTTSGGNSGAYFFSPVHTNTVELSFANQQTRIYADPGTMVGLGANVTDTTTGTPTCFATLSGYLVTP